MYRQKNNIQSFFEEIKLLVNPIIPYFKIEFWIAFIINVSIMVVTYLNEGVIGVEKLIYSFTEQYKGASMVSTALSSFIGLILWGIFYFFNFKNKSVLARISEGLIDTFISLLRLAGGFLMAYTLLHLFVDGFNTGLILFIFYGLYSIGQSSLLVFIKTKMYTRRNREFKKSF